MNSCTKVITVQHKSVFETIMDKGAYRCFKEPTGNLVKPYNDLREDYGYVTNPIFSSPVGSYANFCGANTGKESMMLMFVIPSEWLSFQKYYDWSDYIYYCETPGECADIIEFKKKALHPVIDLNKDVVQCTCEFLLRDWLVDGHMLTNKFREMHDGNGGAYRLQRLDHYYV